MNTKCLRILLTGLVALALFSFVPLAKADAPLQDERASGNNDNFADLAIGVPGESFSTNDIGAAHVLYGGSSGIPSQAGDFWREGADGLPGTGAQWDYFGTEVAAGDFNGDHLADLAIGISGKSVNSQANAGAIQIIYAAAGGLSAEGNDLITQDDLFETAEMNDGFGQVMAVGDFNGDGYDDLAVGVPMEDVQVVSNYLDAGAVNVIYGGESGLGNYNQCFTEYTLGTAQETGDQFGAALAAGDFDGDGIDDLAIGVPFEDFVSVEDVGAVQIVFGTTSWLDTSDNQVLYQGLGGITQTAEEDDYFGRSLAAGYFNGDAYCDLAVGVIGEEPGTAYTDSGAVHVLYASANAFDPPDSDWLWSRNDTDVAGEIQDFAYFGEVLAAGDFDGNGMDDLAIGTPYDDVGAVTDAGSVQVMYGGSTNGLGDWGDRVWYQDSYTNTAAEANDNFGRALAAGDVDMDGCDDLVIGTPSEHIGTTADAGMVQIFFGAYFGIPAHPRYQNFHQSKDLIQDTAEANDRFGWSLAVMQVKGGFTFLPLLVKP
jgi:hypothetical protein